MTKRKISWEEFEKDVRTLARKIQNDNNKYDGIYGVPKGGLILAVLLCHKLNLPMLLTPTKNSLVVDEISDSGVTLSRMKRKKIACIYTTPFTMTKPDYYCKTKQNKDEWLIFPWEIQ
ncbi:MAG: phosphoribosyltransferase [Candidatus Pacearchaeota archaeon]|jgi:hypoxanthine phosphoribosyltransferase